jgi:hypothetical protein
LRFTVQEVEAPEVTLVGVQTSDVMPSTGLTVTVAVVLVPRVALTVTTCADWTDAAVAGKAAEAALATTVTDAGTGRAALLEPSVTTTPPAGAFWFKVTVQVVGAPDVTLTGLHTSVDTPSTGLTVTVAVTLAPSVAVTTAVCVVATEPLTAVNGADVAPAGTVTDAGTARTDGLFELSATALPPGGAASVRFTVQAVDAPEVTLGGLQTTEDARGGGVTVTVAVAVLPSVANTVTV